MNLYSLFTEAELADQIEKKMVKVTSHPHLPLRILNYTQHASYTPEHWNHVTDLCRGLIVDSANTVVARGFKKFWNLGDERHPETLVENLPVEPPILTQKMDGSLGIGYKFGANWKVATRGSFTSEQAVWASNWLTNNSPSIWRYGYTPLFEIIYPANQIVVKYDFSGLVLLGMVDIATGEELERSELEGWAAGNGLRVVETFSRPLHVCAKEDAPNEEGYVAAWPRVGQPPLRCKIKFETYVKLHRLLTQTNAITVWEMLRDGLNPSALAADAPKEFRKWLDGVTEDLIQKSNTIAFRAAEGIRMYGGSMDLADPANKKAFALYVLANYKDVSAVMFTMAVDKDFKPVVWKMIRPSGAARTFVVDEA